MVDWMEKRIPYYGAWRWSCERLERDAKSAVERVFEGEMLIVTVGRDMMQPRKVVLMRERMEEGPRSTRFDEEGARTSYQANDVMGLLVMKPCARDQIISIS